MQAAIVVQVILLISICVDVALMLVLFGAPHKRLTHRLLITNLIGIIGWALGIVLVLQYETMRAVQLAFISPLVIAVSQYWFVHVYPNRRFGTLYECWFLVPALACLMVLLYAPETVVSSFTVVDGYYIRADNGRWAPCYSFFVTILLLYAPLHLYRVARFMPSGIERVRTRQLAVATGIFFLVGVLINSVLPVFLHVYFLNGLGPVFSLILSAYLVYVVRRYRFLDVKLVIQRGVMYVLLLMSVIVVFLLSMLIAGQLFGAPINSMSALTALMATVIVILAYPHLDAHLRQVTNRLFFKKQYDLVEAMNALASIVRERLDLHEVLHTTAKHLHDIFNVPWVCCLTQAYSTTSDVTGGGLPWLNAPERARMFALFAGHTSPISLHRAGESEDLRVAYEYLSAQDVELVVPVCDQYASLTALLVFPIKKSGDTFTGPDVALLSAFAKQLAGSLEKAMLYETEKQHARNLERTVEERTKELRATQEQQRHMMIDISHNMQTPLTILRGQIELLRATASDPETLETVVRSIDRLSAFVYDLLTLSRLDRTDLPFAGAELSLSDLVEDVAELFAVSAEEDGVTLTTVVTPGISLLGERDRVRDLITNLLSNAQKYLKQTGERRITLTLEREGAEAVIRMSDTGIGIRKEDVPRIFDRFFRVGESDAKGTGLGLAICKRIVERHGGTLEVASTHGVGSVFTARFPCTRSTQ